MSNMIDNIYKKASFDETAKHIQAVMETTGRDMIKAMNVLNIPLKKRELLKCAIEGQEIKPEDIPDSLES